MSNNPPPSQLLAVTPVIDYEPPPRAVGHRRPPAPVRQRTTRSPHRPPSGNSTTAVSPVLRAAAVFCDAVLRRVLEVIDRRRPRAQLYPLLTTALVDSVRSMSPGADGLAGAAVLRRVRIQAVGRHDAPVGVEVFGTYTRGRRTHAIACRVEPTPGDTTHRWQVVALHIG